MSTTDEFIEYIMDMLEPLEKLTCRRMFGGAIIKSDGVQIGVIIEDQFYFRIQEDMREAYKAHGSKPFHYKKKGEWITVHAWYSAPEEVVEDPRLFLEWAEEVVAQN